MAEFFLRESANRSPTECAFCKRHTGPFIDTGIELPVYGHIWVCVGDEGRPGCTLQMGRLAGMLDSSIATMLKNDIARIETEVAQLRDERDTGPVLVSRKDLADLLKPPRRVVAKR